MRNSLALFLMMLLMAAHAEEPKFDAPFEFFPTLNSAQALPTQRIIPADIVQESIHSVRFSNNSFGVMWKYTEAGANKMLAFREAHKGEKVRIIIGSFESTQIVAEFQALSETDAKQTQGWLKHRGDKFVGVSEDDAKKIVAGLKSK